MVYKVLKPIGKMVLFFLFKLKMIGKERIPKGPVIIAANHHSNFDPIILSEMFKRPIYFLAKRELFNHAFMNALLHRLNAIPVDRNSGIVIRPVRRSLEAIKSGARLGIFPEGKRCKRGETVKPKKGVAFLGRKTRVPILPVAIIWGQPTFWRTPVTLMIGHPLDPACFMDVSDERLSEIIMDHIKEQSNEEIERRQHHEEARTPQP